MATGTVSIGSARLSFGHGAGTRVRSWRSQDIAFACLWLLVAVISVHDALLVVVNHEIIGAVEQNPIGRWLLRLDNGQVWLFVFVKLVTTALVCTVLVTLYERWRRGGFVVAAALAGFQTTLLSYLTLL